MAHHHDYDRSYENDDRGYGYGYNQDRYYANQDYDRRYDNQRDYNRRDYNQRLNEFKATPVHDWASHGADAFRGLAVRHQIPIERKKQQAANIPTVYSWT